MCAELLRAFCVTAGKNTKKNLNEKSEELVLRVHLHLITHQRIKRLSLLQIVLLVPKYSTQFREGKTTRGRNNK